MRLDIFIADYMAASDLTGVFYHYPLTSFITYDSFNLFLLLIWPHGLFFFFNSLPDVAFFSHLACLFVWSMSEFNFSPVFFISGSGTWWLEVKLQARLVGLVCRLVCRIWQLCFYSGKHLTLLSLASLQAMPCFQPVNPPVEGKAADDQVLTFSRVVVTLPGTSCFPS